MKEGNKNDSNRMNNIIRTNTFKSKRGYKRKFMPFYYLNINLFQKRGNF